MEPLIRGKHLWFVYGLVVLSINCPVGNLSTVCNYQCSTLRNSCVIHTVVCGPMLGCGASDV